MRIRDYTTDGTGTAANQQGQIDVEPDGERHTLVYRIIDRLERKHQLRATFVDVIDDDNIRVEFAYGDGHPLRTRRNSSVIVSEITIRIR